MTRIIAGRARGRRLQSPRGDATRPTSDRVREALFSSLTSTLGTLSGSHFLDLYAGTGAVGLESWSRGCVEVLLVEQAKPACEAIRANIALLNAGAEVTLSASPVATRLAQPPRAGFDVVFVDPPYDVSGSELDQVLALLLEHGWLADHALVVVERSGRNKGFTWPVGLTEGKTRKYGETSLHVAELA